MNIHELKMNDHLTSHSDVFNEQFHHKKKKCFKIHLTFSSFISSAFILHKCMVYKNQENHKNKYAFL